MAIRVGRWDCTVCGTQGNPGPETKCTNCGATRPANVKFYLPEDAEVVSDQSRIREAKAGVDWICGHCKAQNKAGDTLCHSCGNPLDERSEDVDLQTRTYALDEVPDEGGLHESQAAGDQYRKAHRAKIETKSGRKRKRPKGLLALILSSPILAGILFFLLRTFPATIEVEVTEFEWQRSIQFQHYEAVAHEDWQVPQGAFEVSSFRAIHHYDKVFRGYETRTRTVREKVGEERYKCGQKDLGNGYFEDVYCTRPVYQNREETYQTEVYDDVPVYQTKYRFKVMQWISKPEYVRTASAMDHNPQWPVRPRSGDPNNWREGTQKESYRLSVLEDDGDEHSEEVGYKFWTMREKGEKLKAKRSRLLDIYYGLDEPGKER